MSLLNYLQSIITYQNKIKNLIKSKAINKVNWILVHQQIYWKGQEKIYLIF